MSSRCTARPTGRTTSRPGFNCCGEYAVLMALRAASTLKPDYPHHLLLRMGPCRTRPRLLRQELLATDGDTEPSDPEPLANTAQSTVTNLWTELKEAAARIASLEQALEQPGLDLRPGGNPPEKTGRRLSAREGLIRAFDSDPGLSGPRLKVGLEIHQQLATTSCSARTRPSSSIAPAACDSVAGFVPTQSELGEIDAAAIEEAKRSLTFVYEATPNSVWSRRTKTAPSANRRPDIVLRSRSCSTRDARRSRLHAKDRYRRF